MSGEQEQEYKYRFSFEISDEQKAKADRLLDTYGIRKAIMSVVLDDLLNLIEKHGQVIVGILLEGAVKPREIMPSLAKAEKAGEAIRR